MPFDIATAMAVDETDRGAMPKGGFNIDSAFAVEADSNGVTSYNKFVDHQSQPTQELSLNISDEQASPELKAQRQQAKDLEPVKPKLKPGEAQLQPLQVKNAAEFPTHDLLHQPVEAIFDVAKMSGDAIYQSYGGPFLAPHVKESVAAELEQLSAKHPIGSIIAGTAPFIVTAPIFSASLLGSSAQFGTEAAGRELGRQVTEGSLMDTTGQKVKNFAKETSKGIFLGGVFHGSSKLGFIEKPITSALARAGALGVGTVTVNKVYGEDLTQAFKDGGVLMALSLIFESPHLARTVIGRGITARSNTLVNDIRTKTGIYDIDKPNEKIAIEAINPLENNPEVIKKQVIDTINVLADQVKVKPVEQVIEKPIKTVGKTVKENVIGEEKISSVGDIVKNLESKGFLAAPKPIEIRNPETLKEIETTNTELDNLKKSRAFERAQEKYTEELRNEPTALYTPIGIADQMAKAFHIVENNPLEARKIAYGMQEAPMGMRESSISIAYAEKMLEQGNMKEFADAVRSRSLRQTERGQEIVMERAASTNVNDPQTFIKQVLDARMELANKNALKFSFKEKSPATKKAVSEKIKSESKSIKEKFLDKKKLDMAEAQRVIDSLIC